MKNFTATIYTEKLSEFGYKERALLIMLLEAWNECGLPEDFENDGIKFLLNRVKSHKGT